MCSNKHGSLDKNQFIYFNRAGAAQQHTDYSYLGKNRATQT
jgi:hypothetical protein